MQKFRFFEPEDTPERIHIGLRTIKTVIAVFIAAVICYLRGTWPVFAIIAVVICMQTSAGKTLYISLNRILATVIGGSFGVGIVFLADRAGFHDNKILYYLAVSLCMIPAILLTLYIRKPSITALACVVLASVAISRGVEPPYISALNRILDTFIGIVTALAVNLALPNRRAGGRLGRSEPAGNGEPDCGDCEDGEKDKEEK